MITPPRAEDSFSNLGIAPKLLTILQKHKYVTPTPIQQQSIPAAIAGKDLIGIAQTGTGKTLAFGVPMIQRLAQSGGKMKGLVILPTRELAFQVNETLKKIGASLGLKTAILIGGEAMGKQLRALKLNPHVIIATPGRLIDLLDTKHASVANVGILVLDEADRMLDMGFAPQIKKILDRVPTKRQTMLFSATMPDAIVDIAKKYLHMPLRIEVAPAGSTNKSITQEVFFVEKHDKPHLLRTILAQYNGSVLVFSRTKYGARKISKAVQGMGHTSAELHSDRTLAQRLGALEGFKIGKYRVLVATDIAARGIDVAGIQLIINYDLPANAEDYVHRIGRSGRAGLTGHAISFATPDQKTDVRSIERLIKTALPISKSPVASTPRPAPSFSEPTPDRPQHQSGHRGGFSPRPQGHGPSRRPAHHSSAPRREYDKRKTGREPNEHARRKPYVLRKPMGNSPSFFMQRNRDVRDDE